MQIPFFNHWHPTLALRYLPVVENIEKNETVLEVGSGSLGIGPYLKRSFVGVDVDFENINWPGMIRIRATGVDLPQNDNSFDVVVSMDMLEHLPSSKRRKVVSEMFRVARKKVIIGLPIGKKAHEQDKFLDILYKKIHGKRHKFLKEQTEFGLPEKYEMVDLIKSVAKSKNKNIKLRIKPNLNLGLRLWLMKGWISKNILVNIFFRKVLLLAIPLMRQFNNKPEYRNIFIVAIG